MLTSKQRSYLIGLAADLDPVVNVGKAGVNPQALTSLEEAFNTRELVKVNVQKSCPDEVDVAADKLSKRAHAELVKVIGRKFILYRKSKDSPKIELP
ncbi:MAG: ribosome assembly RNA-binding protein YhbY [Lachnospiraceae bacterium]|jgi:RNA-binding protein